MMTGLRIFCDLEGVLVPEMWPHVATRLDIPALAVTTREQPDYAALVTARIATLRAYGITLSALCSAVADMAPYDGAVTFVTALRRHAPVTLVTDSFAPMNEGLVASFSADRLLCHRFVADHDGFIVGHMYWNGLAGKHACLAGSQGPTLAIGDAFNDLTMLRGATCGILFRPSAETRQAGGGLRIRTDYVDVIDALMGMAEKHGASRTG